MAWELGINTHTLLYVRQRTDKVLLYNTGNYNQYLVLTNDKKNLKNNRFIYN